MNIVTHDHLRILSVGNSFSVDTMEHLAAVAKDVGFREIHLGNLYIGGCSVRRHTENAENDYAYYEYLQNHGDGWHSTFDVRMKDALCDDQWDVVAVQHGTADGSRNSDPACYDKLATLVTYIKSHVGDTIPIVFNMTWVGEPYHTHPEIVAFGGDCQKLYERIASVMAHTVVPTKGIDMVSPTGTAIQNARTVLPFALTRDGYHLSLDVGRYIAALTFFKAVTGCAIDEITWAPDGVSEAVRAVCIEAANCAVETPFAVTTLSKR